MLRAIQVLIGLLSILPLEAAALPEVSFVAEVHEDEAAAPRYVRGTMTVRNVKPAPEICFYLPYADETYGEERGTKRRFDSLMGRHEPVVFGGGTLNLEPNVESVLGGPKQVARLKLPVGWTAVDELVLRFTASVPRPPRADANDWFYDGYMPQLLEACPANNLDPTYYRATVAAKYRGTIRIPSHWQYIGPGKAQSDGSIAIDLTARAVPFALGRGWVRHTLTAAGIPVEIAYHTPEFVELATTVAGVLPRLTALLGPYPFPSLAIVETTELQDHGLPGLIALNKPAQMAFKHIQKDWLNWQHWILALQVAHQWYGGAIGAATPDDAWLLDGIADYATLQVLSDMPERFDLFAHREDGSRFLSLSYRQFFELSVAMLRNKAPFAALTTPEFKSRDAALHQHPLLYARHTAAMSQLSGYAGGTAFVGFLRSLTARHLHQTLTPQDFRRHMLSLPSPFSPEKREQLATFLARWWIDEGWPDFALSDFKTEKLEHGRWRTTVEVEQKGGLDYPPQIGIEGAAGHKALERATMDPESGHWVAVFATFFKPERALVDPAHETFDADRFNNHSGFTAVRFFPGNARTLHDDAWTVAWLPYAFRRPGDPFSLGLQAALLRYLQSGLFLRLEGAPSEKVGAVEAMHTFRLQEQAVEGVFKFSQTYEHDRKAEIAATRFPLFSGPVHFGLGVNVRHKERVGLRHTMHQTGSLSFEMRPAARGRLCGYRVQAETERAPAELAEGFSYKRYLSILSGDCNLSARSTLSLRLFRGVLLAEGEPPPQALFKPTDLKEARLRVDVAGLSRVRSLTSLNVDLYLPFFLPIPSDVMILSRHTRWRLFYDYGRATDIGRDYRSYGLGMLLPFGGDLAGAGSMAFARVSTLVILASRFGDEETRRPSIVFDISGEL